MRAGGLLLLACAADPEPWLSELRDLVEETRRTHFAELQLRATVVDDPAALAPWAPPAGASRADAWRAVVAAVEAYPPGQGGIDGGGFKIVEADAAKGYLYAQFESLKNGYVDDLELALVGPSGPLLVRSASRLGFLDFGVNARRLNWIAARLRADGWKAPPIDAATWPDYFAQNRDRP